MKAAGYVYVLINPSMQGLLKIGKTERSSEDRARELSVATGVPTPFLVAFEEHFDDCGAAERLIHALLEERGCRVTPSREFFSLELKEAVRAVSDAKDILGRESLGGPQPSGASVPAHTDVDSALAAGGDVLDAWIAALEKRVDGQAELRSRMTSGEISSGEMVILMRQFRDPETIDPWQELEDQADDAYHGNGESFQDYEEAFRLYKRAASLGSKSAYWNLASMCKEGEGCIKDQGQAVKFLRAGAERGDEMCQLSLADHYLENGEPENAAKCWSMFIRRGIAESEKLLTYGTKSTSWTTQLVYGYFPEVQSGRIPLICADLLARYKEELVAALEQAEQQHSQGAKFSLEVEKYMELRFAAALEVIAALPVV